MGLSSFCLAIFVFFSNRLVKRPKRERAAQHLDFTRIICILLPVCFNVSHLYLSIQYYGWWSCYFIWQSTGLVTRYMVAAPFDMKSLRRVTVESRNTQQPTNEKLNDQEKHRVDSFNSSLEVQLLILVQISVLVSYPVDCHQSSWWRAHKRKWAKCEGEYLIKTAIDTGCSSHFHFYDEVGSMERHCQQWMQLIWKRRNDSHCRHRFVGAKRAHWLFCHQAYEASPPCCQLSYTYCYLIVGIHIWIAWCSSFMWNDIASLPMLEAGVSCLRDFWRNARLRARKERVNSCLDIPRTIQDCRNDPRTVTSDII